MARPLGTTGSAPKAKVPKVRVVKKAYTRGPGKMGDQRSGVASPKPKSATTYKKQPGALAGVVSGAGKVIDAAVHNATADRSGQSLTKSQIASVEAKAKSDPKTRDWMRKNPDWRGGPKPATSSLQAPVLKVLAQVHRPIGAAAATADAVIAGKTPSQIADAARRGFADENAPGFSRPLQTLGAGKKVQKYGGFALDTAASAAYPTFGAGSVAERAAADAGKTTTARVLARTDKAVADATRGKTGASAKAAGERAAGDVRQMAGQAGKRAAARASKGKSTSKGLVVKVLGAEVPGVRRVTASIGAKVPHPKGAPEPLRDVRPTLAPAGANKAEYAAMRDAARSKKATDLRAEATGQAQAGKLKRQIKPSEMPQVLDAIERQNIGSLPTHLQEPARNFRDTRRYEKRIKMRAGRVGDVGNASQPGAAKGYVPHAQETPLLEGKGIVGEERPVARAGAADNSTKRRKAQQPISVLNPQRVAAGKEPFSTNLPLLHANSAAGASRVSTTADLNKAIAVAGREVKVNTSVKGRELDAKSLGNLQPHEGLYHVGQNSEGAYGLHAIDPSAPLPKAGRYVVLDKRNVQAAQDYAKAHHAESGLGRVWDRGTRAWKGAAVFTLAFHARNAVGDTQLAYLQQKSAPKMVRNIGQGIKATHALNQRHKAIENFGKDTALDGKTLKVAGKRMPIRDFVKLAEQHGVTQSGKIGGELKDFRSTVKEGVEGTKKVRAQRATNKVTRAPRTAANAMTTGRENAIRLSTFKDGLDRGMSPAEASRHSLEAHIDYRDLSSVERRVLRRAAPFYTFSARATPFQAKRLVTNPGKFAQLENVRRDIGSSTDTSGFSPYTQRQVPIVIGGKAVTDSLPLNQLNEVPGFLSPGKQLGEWANFGAALLNPIIKAPLELQLNRTFAFRQDIQSKDRPLVNAPGWVSRLSPGLRRKMGVVQGPDKKSGTLAWKWPGKTDYIVRQMMPGLGAQANQLSTSATNKLGQSTKQKVVAAVTGVKITPPDAPTQKINDLYDQVNSLTEKQRALGQQLQKNGSKRDEGIIKQLAAIAMQQHDLEQQIYKASVKRGDKTPLFAPSPRSTSVAKPKGLGGSLGGGGLAGGLGGGL